MGDGTASGALAPRDAPAVLCELSTDVRAAVLVDAAGAPVGDFGIASERATELAELSGELFRAVDRSSPGRPVGEVEVQVEGGGVYAVRSPRFTLAAVADRGALASLALYDLRHVLGRLEGA